MDQLFQIAFQNEEERLDILQKGLAALQNGAVPKDALLFGKKYRKQIEHPKNPAVDVRFISDEIGHGVFMKQILKRGQFVGEYTGIVRRNLKVYFAPLNNYCYEYPIPDAIGKSHVIDATCGNFTRFINHSSKPNLKPHYAFFDGFYHLIFLALRDIGVGEQLSYDYGPHYWTLRSRPLCLLGK